MPRDRPWPDQKCDRCFKKGRDCSANTDTLGRTAAQVLAARNLLPPLSQMSDGDVHMNEPAFADNLQVVLDSPQSALSTQLFQIPQPTRARTYDDSVDDNAYHNK
jgi:hypothetical protein